MQIQTTDGCVLGYEAIYSSSEELAALAFTINYWREKRHQVLPKRQHIFSRL